LGCLLSPFSFPTISDNLLIFISSSPPNGDRCGCRDGPSGTPDKCFPNRNQNGTREPQEVVSEVTERCWSNARAKVAQRLPERRGMQTQSRVVSLATMCRGNAGEAPHRWAYSDRG
jgi:hypothetical protein